MADFFKRESIDEELEIVENEVNTALKETVRNKLPGVAENYRAISSYRSQIYKNLNKSMSAIIENNGREAQNVKYTFQLQRNKMQKITVLGLLH